MGRSRGLIVSCLLVVVAFAAGRAASPGKKQLKQAQKLLAQLKLVDGAGSGLDADTLDGVPVDGFARAGANQNVSITVDGTAGGASIFTDDATGLEVKSGANTINLGFVNHNDTRPIRVRGVGMYDPGNTDFVDFELAPGESRDVALHAAGTNWIDFMAVTRAPVAEVQRLHVTCMFVDSATPEEVARSCIAVR